jgi:hypothetical protein
MLQVFLLTFWWNQVTSPGEIPMKSPILATIYPQLPGHSNHGTLAILRSPHAWRHHQLRCGARGFARFTAAAAQVDDHRRSHGDLASHVCSGRFWLELPTILRGSIFLGYWRGCTSKNMAVNGTLASVQVPEMATESSWGYHVCSCRCTVHQTRQAGKPSN